MERLFINHVSRPCHSTIEVLLKRLPALLYCQRIRKFFIHSFFHWRSVWLLLPRRAT